MKLPSLITIANVDKDPDSVAELRARCEAGVLIDYAKRVIAGQLYMDKQQVALLQKLLDKVLPNASPEPAGLPARSVEQALENAALRGDVSAQRTYLERQGGGPTQRPYVVVVPQSVGSVGEWLEQMGPKRVEGSGGAGG